MKRISPSDAPTQSRARYFWHTVGYFVALVVITLTVFRVLFPALSLLVPRLAAPLVEAFYLVLIIALTWFFCRLDHSSIGDLGLRRQRWILNLMIGLGFGVGLILLVFVVEVAAGWLIVEEISWSASLVILMISSASSAFTEELTFRGYMMQSLAKAWGMPASILVTSLLFGMVHMLNPHFSVLGFLNVCAFGALFAFSYLVTRSLWVPIGIHIGWNLTEFHILGLPGSGYTEPSILHSTVSGPSIVTGGNFGPEGGFLGLATLLLGFVLLSISYRMTFGKKKKHKITREEGNAR